MIITNWPDKCPNCKTVNFQVFRPLESKIEAEGWAPTNNKLVRFKCRGKLCDHQWTLELVGIDPSIVTHRSYNPMAVVTDPETSPLEVLALDETWTATKLSTLIERGAKRSTYVLERAEIECAANQEALKHRGPGEDGQSS